MEVLKVIENGLIPIYENNMGQQLVDARELHGFLGSRQDFSEWIKKRIEECGAEEAEDFSIILGKSTGGRPSKDYILTMDMAKEVAMLERNERGKAIRKYFIQIEKKYKEQVMAISELSPELQMFKKIFDTAAMHQLEQKRIRQEIASAKEDLEEVREVIMINPKDRWREETNKLVTKVCKKLGNYKLPKEEIYKALEGRAHCHLARRLDNMKARLSKNGSAKSKIDSLNFLDVIEEDPKLKEIYTAIVKEMSIKHGVGV